MPMAFASDAVKFFCRSADLSIERRMGMLRWHVDLISFEQKTRRIPSPPSLLLLSLSLPLREELASVSDDSRTELLDS